MAKRSSREKGGKGKPTQGDGWEFIPAASRQAAAPAARRKSDPPGEQRIQVREEKRSGGKVVTVARGFRLTEQDQKALAKRLKTRCSAGGTTDGDAIEVQGRHRDKLIAALSDLGYQAGGG